LEEREKFGSPTITAPLYRPTDKDYVCTKGMYSQNVSPQRLADFVQFYTNRWKFTAEISMTTAKTIFDVVSENKILQQFVNDGKLIIVDLREHFQRLYGPLFQDFLLFSTVIGQLVTQHDCFSRAKQIMPDGSLGLDVDEYITYGKNFTVRPD